ncbi:MAG: carbohydrate ABC transporter permease [Lachnospiraceae bacterium]|nr:carbohydrate ABC transporter permease [Lachnospiraceae bacterium]
MQEKKKFKMPSKSRVAFNILNYGIFGLFTFLCIYPLWYIFIYSISEPSRSAVETVILWPLGFSLSNLKQVLQLKGFFTSVMVSVARTVLGTCATVFSCTLLGYVFTKHHFPARNFLYRMLIVTMYIGGGMIPTYLVYRSYGFVNNFLVYIVPSMISAYYVILIKTYIESIPPSLEESAILDGAGYMTVLVRIIMPMSKPIIATIGVYAAVGQWNAWFDNHIYNFTNKKLEVLQYKLYKFLQEAQQLVDLMQESSQEINVENMLTPFAVRMTVTFLTVMPILFVYPFLQRYIVKGIMIGAVKG